MGYGTGTLCCSIGLPVCSLDTLGCGMVTSGCSYGTSGCGTGTLCCSIEYYNAAYAPHAVVWALQSRVLATYAVIYICTSDYGMGTAVIWGP